MTVKIVKGLISKADPAQAAKNTSQQQGAAAKASGAQIAQSAQITSNSEAVVTTISSQKSFSGSEKIKSHKEAKAAADSVADKIRHGGGDVHELGGASGQVLL